MAEAGVEGHYEPLLAPEQAGQCHFPTSLSTYGNKADLDSSTLFQWTSGIRACVARVVRVVRVQTSRHSLEGRPQAIKMERVWAAVAAQQCAGLVAAMAEILQFRTRIRIKAVSYTK